MQQEYVEKIVSEVLKNFYRIKVGISNRHLHLSHEVLHQLFGTGYELKEIKKLTQPGEYACAETVLLVGPKGLIKNARVLGPLRKYTQVEISRTDGYMLGVSPPVRDSGNLSGSPGITIIGPKGTVILKEGLICARRHVHMNNFDADRLGVINGERISTEVLGNRGAVLNNVVVRVHPDYQLELHLDTDEANAVGLKNGDFVKVIPSIRGVVANEY